MNERVLRWLDELRTGFWFVPTTMLAGACVLALALLRVDEHYDPGMQSALGWAYSGGPEGARSLLSTIAGSMITAASVTFSLAAVALSIASQQYGSRVLRNFMRDRVTQFLLGTFLATFIYSVLVIRTIRGSDYGGGFVPAISVTGAIALSLVSLVLLIYFVHHVSSSIQASQIVRVVAKATEQAIPGRYPSESGHPHGDMDALDERRKQGSAAVAAEKSGYVQTIDLHSLMKVARGQDVLLEIVVTPGDHLIAGTTVVRAWGRQTLDAAAVKAILAAFYLDYQRTPAQDIRYQFQQLTDIVVRALSPGINDPFTAVNGIDALASSAALLARRDRVAGQREDEDGTVRLLIRATGLAEILEETVGHIVIYAAGDRFVMDALRRVLDAVQPELRDDEERSTVFSLRAELDTKQKAEAAA